ncbi:MAG: hypoxanthine phosphoribosyltransferase [Dehalococcoidales bacterium]|nr:hypoxanthine phosphoribosyltransferase [Dehalococcoidales bacterium]
MSSDVDLQVCITEADINKTIDRMADEINRDYRDKNPLVIGVLIGSFIFLADLVRRLTFPLDIDFTRLSSYSSGTTTSGEVKMLLEPSIEIQGRDILIVEDIADTGYSISYLMRYLKERNPNSLRLCVLADKPSNRKVHIDIDYKGFTVPGDFLVGYGLDYQSKYRNLPDLCVLGENGE